MSDGKTLRGQLLNSSDLRFVLFTQEMCDIKTMLTYRGQPNVEIIPHDKSNCIVRIYDVAALEAALANVFDSFPTRVNITFPPILHGVTAQFSKNSGSGSSSHPTSQQQSVFVGSSGTVRLSPNSTAQGSAVITPGVSPDIEEIYGQNIPATSYLFYLPQGTITEAQILAKVTVFAGATVLPFPVFKPESVTFTLKGQQTSAQASADTTASGSASSGGATATYEWGNGSSLEVGASIRDFRIPPTLHGELTVDTPSDTSSFTVTVNASTTALSGGVGGNSFSIAPITNAPTPITGTATGIVTPSSISATSPADVPRTGLYLFDSRLQDSFYGVRSILVTVVDFSYFA